jgi:hypothetical protein
VSWRRVRSRSAVVSVLVACCLALLTQSARAGDKEDKAAIATVESVLTHDIAQANFGEARKKLKNAFDHCKKGCSPSAIARIHVAQGMVAAQLGQADEAKSFWSDALNADPNATLPTTGATPAIKQQWADAQKAWITANPQPDDAQKAGWVNKQAYDLAKAGVAAEVSGNFPDCIDKDKAALTLEENNRARLHLALCEAKAGKVIDALRDNSKALEFARSKNDAATVKLVQDRVTELLPRLGHVKFTIDPGTHAVHAEGFLRGARVSYDGSVDVKDGETVLVKVTLKPAALTQGQLQCMVTARTQEEILACLPSDKKPLVVHAGLDMSGYTDTLAVNVLSPAVRGSVSSPTAGWNVGASYLVDVVTAASPDLVASASSRFRDVRHAVSLNGAYKPGTIGGQLFGNLSVENDYVSRTVGGGVNIDVLDKQLTPSLSFAHTWDTIGRTGVDFDTYSKAFRTEEITAGLTIVASPVSVLVLGASVALESGDQSKPYRYVPLFEPGVSVPVGASPDEVNRTRLPAKPLEQLPLDRQRFSIGARYIRRIGGNKTLRLEERLYDDTWGTRAATTDFAYFIDASSRLRLWPHLHLHGQTGAVFYQRIYGATLNPDGSATIPQYRSTDRELSPMIGVTGGGGVRVALTDPSSKFQFAVFTAGDTLFNDYFNALYVRTRFAFYGTLGIEADFE